MISLYEISIISKSIDKKRLVIAKGWGEEDVKWLLIGYKVSLRGAENSGNWKRQQLHKMVNILNTTELYALKWLTQYYVKFTLITKGFKKNKNIHLLFQSVHESEICTYFKWVLYSGSHKAAIKVLVRLHSDQRLDWKWDLVFCLFVWNFP